MANKIFRNALFAFPLMISLQVMAQSNATQPTATGQKLQANGLADFGFGINNGHARPWPQIAEKDITYKKREYTDINPLLNENKIFDPGSSNNPLYTIILNGIKAGIIKAYSGENHYFNTAMTSEEVFQKMAVASGPMAMPISSVVKGYCVLDDMLEVANKKGQFFNRIRGIAILATNDQPADGPALKPLFWIYYPEAADYLATFQAPSAPGKPSMNWFEVFESRSFKGNTMEVNFHKGLK